MLIVCPSCASEYDVDPARIGPAGREVRCAECRTTWHVGPVAASPPPPGTGLLAPYEPDDVPAPLAVMEAHPAPPAGRGRPAARTRETPRARSPILNRQRASAGLLVALLLAAPGAVALRVPIVRALPGSEAVFALLGLPVNLVGLRIGEVSSGLVEDKAGRLLVVDGEIRSAAPRTVAVPRLAFTVEGELGETLYSWSAAPPLAEIGPGEAARFSVRLPSPPPAGRRILVSFGTDGRRDAVALR